jgi:protein-tyrosine sulfotransferase
MRNPALVKFIYNTSKLYGFKNAISKPTDTYSPFFILGSGRNGSTLLSSMLNNHSEIVVPLENYVLPYAIIKYRLYNFLEWNDLIRLIIADFDDETQTEFWELSFKGFYNQMKELPKNERSFRRLYHEINLLYAKQKGFEKKIAWGDKSPHNVRKIEYIYPVFKNSKYIFLLRDGRAVCNSLIHGKKETFANHTTINGATDLWKQCIEKYEWLKKRIPKENLLFVKYEDLVATPEETSKNILSFLGYKYENLEQGRKERVSKLGFTKSEHHANTSNEISVSRTEKWKTELSKEEIEEITNKIKPNLKQYGYL